MIGTAAGTLMPYAVSKTVTGIGVKQLGPHGPTTKQPISGFILYYDDATTALIGPVAPGDTEFYSDILVNFVGLKCDLH